MKALLGIGIVAISLVFSIIAKPHGFDDEGEISVPRSPKIQGPAENNISYSNGTSLNNLECDIEGSPTPTVIWFKDEKEIQSGSNLYNTSYDVTDGKALLAFTQSAYKSENDVLGNFTCIAANFLGRSQKKFRVEKSEYNNVTNEVQTEPNSTDAATTVNGFTTQVVKEPTEASTGDETTSPASRLIQRLGA